MFKSGLNKIKQDLKFFDFYFEYPDLIPKAFEKPSFILTSLDPIALFGEARPPVNCLILFLYPGCEVLGLLEVRSEVIAPAYKFA